MKGRKRTICVLLAFVLLFCPFSEVYADSPTSDTIKEKEGAISDAKKQRDSLRAGVTDVKKLVQELEATKADLSKYVTKLDANLNVIEAKIEKLKKLIKQKEEEITKTEKALDEAEKTRKEQYAVMKKRVRFIYENGDGYYLEILLHSKTFGAMLNKADYVEKIAAYDRNLLKEYQKTCKNIAEQKENLEAEKIVLNEAKKDVDAEQASVSVLIDQKKNQIGDFNVDISNKQEMIKEYEAQIAAQDATISALEAAVAEEKKRLAEQNKEATKYDGGKFAWPAPSYTRVSDDYGNRMHPILKVQQFHNGIDLAAPSGSPILAAYSGTVVAADYSSTMGNYIMIDHGDTLYTIYMHASALYVSKGAEVTRGQQIAAVGSTGRSTGAHLHFSVRLNGSYTSPWNYLSQ